MPEISTRTEIIQAADDLFYRRGYTDTSFADIAAAVGISRGNFYYHFKSKDAILDAVLAKRLQDREEWLATWQDREPAPEERIRLFIDILVMNQDNIVNYGCPLGTMSMELSKLGHPAMPAAAKLFTLFRDWLHIQFTALGCADRSKHLAMNLLRDSQGIAVMGNAFGDGAYLRDEVKRLHQWLDDVVKETVTGKE